MANNRYDENRERFEGGRGQDAGRRGEGGWGDNEGRNFENQGDDRQNYGGNYSNYGGSDSLNFGGGNRNYGNQPQFDQGHGNRGYNSGNQSGQDWDRNRQRSMTSTYPRQNEWSQEHGVSSGLGGSENSEYSSSPRSGNTYFGQNQFGGGLNQPGGGSQSQFGGGLGQYGDQGQQGRHHGKGPKGYKRSDERIKEDVNERLTHDPHIDASEIEVQVKDGEVTLTGTVDSRQAKRRAEEIIENLSGVRDVHNQLKAQSGDNSGGSGSQNAGSQNKETTGAGSRSGKP